MTTFLLAVVGVGLLLAGPILIARGTAGRRSIRAELSEQKIVFPDRHELPAALAGYAGVQVRTGEHARAFADFIGANVARATGGRTYAQIAEELQACGGSDERLTRLRQTAFMGQTLRGSLLGAYQAWQVTTLVIGLGALVAAMGLAFLALAVTGA